MKPKFLITTLLLAFVALSLTAMVVREVRSSNNGRAALAAAEVDANVDAEHTRFVVYYFHGNLRCVTCRLIQSQSEEAIAGFFGDQLASGEMEWQEINFDLPEHAHFRKDFDLAFQSLIVAEVQGSTVVRWHNLMDVWSKVHQSRAEFDQYVLDTVADFITVEAPS